MEFLEANFINTTTQISVNNNTALAENIFNRDLFSQYASTGDNSDLTTTSITISFTATTTVDRIALLNHNVKSFTFFYNGATANTFSLTTTADTTTSNYSSNSETSMYWRVTSVDVTSVTFDLKETIVADAEKAVGLLYLGKLNLDFDRDPSAKNYKPRLNPKRVEHKLSDGGTRIHYIIDKYRADIKFKYITESFRNSLKSVYDSHDPIVFAPFGTTTSWDGVFFESVWTGDFTFFEYSDDAPGTGFSGKIRLEETPI